jgi:hypothetical protein
MNYIADEPQSPGVSPRPCSTPHSAPVAWLKSEQLEADATAHPPETLLAAEDLDDIVALLRSDPQALAEVTSRLAPEDSRRDGWTPFHRRLFLEVLAETGRVSLACEYCRLSKQSAYALRARDPLFAAGWATNATSAPAPSRKSPSSRQTPPAPEPSTGPRTRR